ncbi:MAG: DMT family transporter [Spirochaetales bacterium]|nr:DMT family transporter [Spirochaetales bacterium]
MPHRLKKTLSDRPALFIVLLVFCMAIWGGSWTSGKLVADAVHPFVLSFLRFFVTFLCFVPAVIVLRQNLKIGLKGLLFAAAAGALMNLYSYLFFRGLEPGQAGLGGVLVTSLNPVFTFLLSLALFRMRIGAGRIIGLALGVAGGLVILEIWNISPASLLSSGNLVFIIGSVVWSILTIVSGEAQKRATIFAFGFFMYGFSSLFGLPFALAAGLADVVKLDLGFWLNILYLGAASTFFATSVFFYAARKLTAGRASSFSLFTPVFAVVSSYFVLGEIPTVFTITGGVIAMIGIYLINRKGKQDPAPRSAAMKGDAADVEK